MQLPMPYEYPANPEYPENPEHTANLEYPVIPEARHPDHQKTLNLHALSCKPRCMTMKMQRHLSLRIPRCLSFRLSVEPAVAGFLLKPGLATCQEVHGFLLSC